MKSICIVHSSMEIGGAETSLIGLLHSIDYAKYSVDLYLLSMSGDLMGLIPSEVNIMSLPNSYQQLSLPIKQVVKNGYIHIALMRLIAKLRAKKYKSITYMTKHYSHRYSMRFLKPLEKKYNLAISFIDPHYIVLNKIYAEVKVGWMHTDFSRTEIDKKSDLKMWDECDYIVNVSDGCKKSFDRKYPSLSDKSIVIENILSEKYVRKQAENTNVESEMINNGSIKILSVGRFTEAKNFDNVPCICQTLIKKGLNVVWYLIGYGADEQLIRKKIVECNMESNVIILGKKDNPYPYIANCDVYIQPSRYEGKSVSVREAQVLGKPVIITNYKTARSQLEDGIDGFIVSMNNEECAKDILKLLKTPHLLSKVSRNCNTRDYSNAKEIEKLYCLMQEQ